MLTARPLGSDAVVYRGPPSTTAGTINGRVSGGTVFRVGEVQGGYRMSNDPVGRVHFKVTRRSVNANLLASVRIFRDNCPGAILRNNYDAA